ncbi:hypothetical protein JCM14244_05720 [Venenivibrio stagnispumantis]|uniref:Glycosyltransferase 2-like domain-containing protein n=1 Tax=Venenivibrio stagnispumantis TaxID=407998 RepID=A0AA45WI61_9AQUI|nr:glycosyltransferase [Venenivibrio stagnispumantis]MCW4572745.1 glycosyltransferase [Venenivibrio stagnispumantis]SMP00251.1 hypothetical protein SAMN06264868_10133 [Venenivibrio stagnispumantis]
MKISVLIPTYNRPHYLIEALESILNQTLQPDEIIIADDNVDDRETNFKALLPYLEKYPHIKYVQNIHRLGGAGNYKNLFYLARGEYIKYLAEDDILYPENLEKLSKILDSDENITVATSVRDVINEVTKEKIEIPAATQIFPEDTIIDGKIVIKKSIIDSQNYIGEFSTYMFRKKDVDFELFKCCDFEFKANADWFLWMSLAKKGKVAYLTQPLSMFRFGHTNEQLSEEQMINGLNELLFFVSNQFLNYLDIDIDIKDKFNVYDKLIGNLHFTSLSLAQKNEANQKLMNIKNKLLSKIKEDINKCQYEDKIEQNVSIIIVTYNNEDTIYQCLDSVSRNMRKDDEVIIVDNNSRDNTLNIVKSFNDKRIKILSLNENIGYSAGINRGIEYAKYDFYIFLNPDTIVTKNFVQKLLDPLINHGYAASSPLSSYVIPNQHLRYYSKISILFEDLSYDEISDYLGCLYKDEPYKESKLLVGFCLATKKEIVDKIGGLDEDLFLGNDDLEFSWRLQLNGYKQAIVKNCFIYHKGHESFRKSGSIAEKLVEESTNILAQKLVDYYGYGNVPTPEKLWGISWFCPTDKKYAFMFKYSDKDIDFKKVEEEIKNNKYSVAIILVNYKNWKDTKECVNSLKNLDYKNFAIFIVDNSEEDKEIIKNYYKDEYQIIEENEEIKDFSKPVVILTENKGFSHANNVAIKKIKDKFDYIWVLNNDTVVNPDTLSHLLETSLKTDNPVVTCKIKDFHQKDKVQYNGVMASYIPIDDTPDRIKEAKFLSGANLLMKSKIYDEIGLWEECYFLYYEDNDIHQRLLKKGYKLIYTPYTEIYHKGGSTIGKWKQNELSLYYAMRNRALFMKKHYGDIDDSYFIELVKDYFNNYVENIGNLRTIFTVVIDIFTGKTGKSFNPDLIINYKRKDEDKLREIYKDAPKELLELYVKCMNKPRDKEQFTELIKFARKGYGQ